MPVAAAPRALVGVRGALVVAAWVGAVQGIGHLVGHPDMGLGAWWSSVGLITPVLALNPLRRWPLLIALAGAISLVAHLLVAEPRDAVTVTVVHLVAAAAAAAVLSDRGRRAAGCSDVEDLVRLAIASVLVGVLASAVETPLLRGDHPVVAFAAAMLAQHTLSAALLTAVILAWHRPEGWYGDSRETLVQVVALALSLGTIALDGFPVAFLLVPLLTWAALRLDVRVVTSELVGVAAVVAAATADGQGAQLTDIELAAGQWSSNAIIEAYILCLLVVCLPIAVLTSLRRELLQQADRDAWRFRRNFSESPVGKLFLRVDDGAVLVEEGNPAALSILGLPAEAIEGRRLGDLLTGAPDLQAALAPVLAGRLDAWHGDLSVAARPDSVVQTSVTALDRDAKDQGLIANLLDLTEERRARARLEEAHHLNDATLDTTACVILVIDAEGRIVRVNAATHDITGYASAELVGRLVWETAVAPLTEFETHALFLWPNRSGAPSVRERQHRRADGSEVRVVWSCNVVPGDDDTRGYAVMTGIDVTAERHSSGLIMHLMRVSVFTALITIDDAGIITMANVGADQLVGGQAGELVGRRFVDLLDPEQVRERVGDATPSDPFERLVASMGGSESRLQDWTWVTRGGRTRIVSMTLSADDSGAGPVGYLCVARDVTEQRQAQQSVLLALEKERTAVERLRTLDQAKDEFVSTVSHELRTPVTSILGYAELLHDEIDDGTAAAQHLLAMLETITRNGERLTSICNDLLLLSGFEHLSDHLVTARHDLRPVVQLAEESARSLALDRDLQISCRLPDQPVWVDGDRAQLDRMLVNLVSNAVKFTPDGGRVDLALEAGDDAVLTVSDTGIGIDPVDHDQVFQRFYRTEPAQSLAIQGTGLGLAIVAGIVEAHRGRIELDSSRGHGATFTIRLPRVAEPGPSAGSRAAGRRISRRD